MTGSPSASRPWGGGGLLLADELFCVAHDDRTGRSRLRHRVLALGLAAGLLGELVLFRRVEILDGGVLRLASREALPEALAHGILQHLLAQPHHRDVRIWLAFLADFAVESVAHRLVLAGVWERVERRRLGRVRVSHLPVDANVVAWRAMRLGRLLISPEPIAEADVMLAGLVAITGLTKVVLWQPEHRESALTRIHAEVRRLPWPLHHLLAFTEVALGDAVLAPR